MTSPTQVPPSPPAPAQVVVINESTAVTDSDVESWVPALQTQVSSHFAPMWDADATLSFVPTTQTPPPAAWQLVVLDDSDQAGALGYHDLTSAGLPLAKVFAKSDLQANSSVSVTCSHELLEMLGDPMIDMVAFLQDSGGNPVGVAYEACDVCEDDSYGYEIAGVLVSDFVYRHWFDDRPNPAGVLSTALDYGGHVTSAMNPSEPAASILPGGYIGIWTSSQGWTQVTGSARSGDPTAVAPPGSRRERRTRRGQWQLSLPPDEIAKRRQHAR
ncbi:MAG TPA: hypothetical protein VGP46_12295 [Acidimicrobiales bacterium]|jgi:hypothetical protein|nr:hypothetical protein [Acidimicrobiales bacterium]